MTRIAIFSGPYPVDDGLGGIGLRLWEIAQILGDAGHGVTIVAPRESEFAHPGVRVSVFANGSWRKVVDASDVVVTTDLPDTRVLLHAHHTGTRLVAENAPPIEHLHYARLREPGHGQALYRDLVARWRLQLLLADHLLVRSEAERAATLGALVTIGRMAGLHHHCDPARRQFLSLLPIGFTRHAARAAEAATPVGPPVDLLWNGGVWDYCEPGPVLGAMAAAKASGHPLTLRLMYPFAADATERLRRQVRTLGLGEQVLWPTDPPLHRRRDNLMKTARVIVITGGRTAETATCHRLRLRDSGLYHLPVVVDHHGATADVVAALGIGAVVDPTDPRAMATALVDAVRASPTRAGYLAALHQHRGRFQLEAHVGGLLAFLDAGRRAADIGSAEHTNAVEELIRSHPDLQCRGPDVL